MRFLLPSAALVLFVFSHIALAQESGNCATIVKSAQDAANRADWVIEGNVVGTSRMNSTPPHIDVNIENARVLHELEHSPRFFTAVLQPDSCFPNSMTTLWGRDADKLVGKRMRFFGMRSTSGRGRRFFFMQPAEQAMPSFPATRNDYADKEHLPIAVAERDGWYKVRSTDGGYSVEMPGMPRDITKGSGTQPAFMLRGTDRYGSTFQVVFERSGPGSEMAGTFDSTISKPGANVIKFKGADAVSTLGELAGSAGAKITHGLWLRVPGGTYMLGIVTDRAHEAESLKFKERFFNSLTFE
jgi:hypothetical protein